MKSSDFVSSPPSSTQKMEHLYPWWQENLVKVLIRWSGVHFDLVGSKEVAGGDISNGEGGGKFSTGDIVEKMKSICKQVPVSRCSVDILG